MALYFEDRIDAGRRLADALISLVTPDSIVCVLPRGGVPIGFVIASMLKLPLTVLVARKLGYPPQPEFAIGAIAEGNVKVLNTSTIARLSVTKDGLAQIIKNEKKELNRRVLIYRHGTKLKLNGKAILLVDDGIATGLTMKAAIKALRRYAVKRILCAVPVSSPAAAHELTHLVDRFVSLYTPHDFGPVSKHYRTFPQTTDQEVCDALLAIAAAHSYNE
ncbi:MAG: phosphoribosyltransferase family protein [Candidatus Roizmanbacteria bacterium]|nr:phosphoribosyltransferase family protein [Candidatus Roizmanbacteria bacterium]